MLRLAQVLELDKDVPAGLEEETILRPVVALPFELADEPARRLRLDDYECLDVSLNHGINP